MELYKFLFNRVADISTFSTFRPQQWTKITGGRNDKVAAKRDEKKKKKLKKKTAKCWNWSKDTEILKRTNKVLEV